jgi:hypothetical protein
MVNKYWILLAELAGRRDAGSGGVAGMQKMPHGRI